MIDADMADLEELLPGPDDVARFAADGWWVSPPVLTADVVDTAWRGAERLYAGEYDAPLRDGTTHLGWSAADGDVLRKNDEASLLVHELRAITNHPLIGAIAARLSGAGSIRLWHDQLLYKSSQDTSTGDAGDDLAARNVGWHTDRQYWRAASSTSMLTAWVPFHDVRHEHGPVMFVDGSHRWGDAEHEITGDFWNTDLDALHRLVSDREVTVSEALVPRGGISFHHCRTVHGSGPNVSGEPRRAIAVHLQDGPNRYSRAVGPDGAPAAHGIDAFVRRTADGDPDYTDPDVCPQLWP